MPIDDQEFETALIEGNTKVFLRLKNIEGISHIELDEEDVVRHRLVKQIIKAYNKDDAKKVEFKLEEENRHKFEKK